MQNPKGAGIGALLGAGIGSLIGYAAYKDEEKKFPKNDVPFKPDDQYPSLTKPKLRAVWVPDQIEGNKYIRGHYVYVIEDAGTWSKD